MRYNKNSRQQSYCRACGLIAVDLVCPYCNSTIDVPVIHEAKNGCRPRFISVAGACLLTVAGVIPAVVTTGESSETPTVTAEAVVVSTTISTASVMESASNTTIQEAVTNSAQVAKTPTMEKPSRNSSSLGSVLIVPSPSTTRPSSTTVAPTTTVPVTRPSSTTVAPTTTVPVTRPSSTTVAPTTTTVASLVTIVSESYSAPSLEGNNPWITYSATLKCENGCALPLNIGGRLCVTGRNFEDATCTGAILGSSGSISQRTYTGLFGFGGSPDSLLRSSYLAPSVNSQTLFLNGSRTISWR
jgi:hypothetical protein